MRASITIAISLLGAACADKLEPKAVDELADAGADGYEKSGPFASKSLQDGAIDTKVDAFDSALWQRFDLDMATEASDDAAWDLAFSRYFIHMNGGVSGDQGVAAIAVETAFDALTHAPSEGFESDAPDSDGDTNTEPDNPFNSPAKSWFDYEPNKHTLSPAKGSYVVRSSQAAYFALEFEGYYDRAGTPGQMRFRWKEIDAPE